MHVSEFQVFGSVVDSYQVRIQFYRCLYLEMIISVFVLRLPPKPIKRDSAFLQAKRNTDRHDCVCQEV